MLLGDETTLSKSLKRKNKKMPWIYIDSSVYHRLIWLWSKPFVYGLAYGKITIIFLQPFTWKFISYIHIRNVHAEIWCMHKYLFVIIRVSWTFDFNHLLKLQFLSVIIICWLTVIWFQVLLSNTNNLHCDMTPSIKWKTILASGNYSLYN